jgi:uncharacterized protein YbjT (DUF2867 family)
MSEKKIIVVTGATGAQGGGLVRAILNDKSGEYAARALTRDVNSPKAKELERMGAEVVSADLDDRDSLKEAFRGAYGAFCVTFFWDHFSPEKENAHAKAMAGAARNAGIKHVIWSTLEDTRRWVPASDTRMPTLMGRYKVPHFDAKGESDQYFNGLPVTNLLTTFYWDNLIGMAPKKGPDGTLVFTLPIADKKIAGIVAEDIGKCAYGIFKRGQEFISKTIGIASELLTGTQIAAALATALARPVHYNAVTPAAFRDFGFPGAADLGNMFQFYAEFESHFAETRDVALARSLNPSLQTLAQWLAANASRIPIE